MRTSLSTQLSIDQVNSTLLGSALAIRLGSTRSARLDRLNNLPTTYQHKIQGVAGGEFL